MSHMDDQDAYWAFYQECGRLPGLQVARFNERRMCHFQPKPGKWILELGCGTGGNLVVFGKICPMVGVELSEPMVKTARRVLRCQRGLQPVEVVAGWIEEFHDPRQFDYVLLTEVLEHVFNPVDVLRVARKHMASDGQVYISAPAIRVGGVSHVRGVPYGELTRWLKEADLKAVWHIEQPNKLGSDTYQQTICKAVAA